MSNSSTRNWLIPVLIVGAVVAAVLAFGVFGVQTLFIDDEVSEAAPVFTSTAADTQSGDQSSTDPADADVEADDQTADDSGSQTAETDAVEPITAATGSFVDGAHPTSGTANVLTDGGSQRVLRLEDDFVSDNGPDLNVYLASSGDDFGDEYIDLGDLKGNIGSQNYEVPADVDLTVYDTVVIWCVRFGVGFGSAELA